LTETLAALKTAVQQPAIRTRRPKSNGALTFWQITWLTRS